MHKFRKKLIFWCYIYEYGRCWSSNWWLNLQTSLMSGRDSKARRKINGNIVLMRTLGRIFLMCVSFSNVPTRTCSWKRHWKRNERKQSRSCSSSSSSSSSSSASPWATSSSYPRSFLASKRCSSWGIYSWTQGSHGTSTPISASYLLEANWDDWVPSSSFLESGLACGGGDDQLAFVAVF